MKWILSAALALCLAAPSQAAEIGDDGLHKAPWMRETFKDLSEDLAEASDEGKRLMVMIEQRGCIYCAKMHQEVFPVPRISDYIEENFFVVQINMFGDVEVTDFDGTTLPEKDMVKRWGVLFTPTIIFLPEEVPDTMMAPQAAVATMPGAFGENTTYDMLTWVFDRAYLGDETFQKYHARKLAERSQ